MTRYVFFPENDSATPLVAAKKAAAVHGAIVVSVAEGAMLLDASPTKAANLVKALRGWQYALERKTSRLPERTPLERAKLLASKR